MAINKKLIYYNRTLANFKSDANGLNGQTTASGGNVGNIPYASIVFTSDGYIWTHGKEFNCNNTWRGIQNNLTSTSTTDSLSAYQGKILNEKFANYLPLSGGTLTGALTVPSLTVTGASTFSQAINGSILGNAATASRLLNARTITIGSLSNSFDGSANISYSLASIGAFASSSFTLANIKSTLGISDWALASSKPSYNFSEIGVGTAVIGDGANYLLWRSKSSWVSGVYYHTTGNEAVVFGNVNANTSWIFATTNPKNRADWTTLTPSMQIKNGKVAINKLIANGANLTYALEVNGDVQATNFRGNLIGNASTVTNGVYTTGDQTISGNKTFSGSTSLDDTTIGNLVVTGGASFAQTINGNIATANKVNHTLTFTGGVTGTFDGSADKSVAIPTKSSWNYDDVYLKLSGGILSGSAGLNAMFVVNSTNSVGPSITLRASGTVKSHWGYYPTGTYTYLSNEVAKAELRIYDNGDFKFTTNYANSSNLYTVYHTGNLSPMTTSHAANAITSTKISNWDAVYTWYTTAAGTSASGVIDNWNEIKNFIDGFHESDDLAEYLVNTFVAKTGGTMTGALTTPSLTVTGASSFSLAINSSILGNAATASRLLNARNIAISGAVTGNANFDGSGNITISTSVNHTHAYYSSSGGALGGNISVNAKYTFNDDPTGYDYGGLYRNSLITASGDATTMWLFSYNKIKIDGSEVSISNAIINGGTPITSSNIGSLSVNYASNADTVDNKHAADFAESGVISANVDLNDTLSYKGIYRISSPHNNSPGSYGLLLSLGRSDTYGQLYFGYSDHNIYGRAGLNKANASFNASVDAVWRRLAWATETVMLSGNQTISGNKTFSGSISLDDATIGNLVVTGGASFALTINGSITGNADTVDGKHSTDFLAWSGMSASGGSSAPFQTSVDFFNNTANLSAGARMIYNHPGTEYTILYTRRSDATGHGTILKWGYTDKYIRIIRMISGSAQSTDWEKISAGYADSAGAVSWDNVSSKPATATRWPSWSEVTSKPNVVEYDTSTTRATVDGTNNYPHFYNLEGNNLISGYLNYWYVLNMGKHTGNNFASLIAMNYQDAITDTDMFIRTANGSSWRAWRRVLHDNNYSSYALPLSGGTMTGALTVPTLTVSGASTFSQAINGSILGNAATASRLLNARTIFGLSFDGSTNVSGNLTASHIYMGGYLYMLFGGSWLSTIDNDGNGPIFGYALAANNRRAYYVGSPVYICGGSYSNYASGITVNSSNNIGIGTTSPSYKLHVSGGLLAITNNSNTVTIGSQNTAWCHIESGKQFYMSNSVWVNGTLGIYNGGSCNYYINNATSVLNDLRVSGADLYIGSASGSQCHQQYDSTNKVLKFIFD